jgi:two-component sensor histidine kinase
MVHRIAQLRRLAAAVTRSPTAYGIAILAFAVAFGVRYAVSVILDYGLHDWLSPAPFLTFYPTIILTTFFLGSGPAVLVAALGGASAWYFFLEPMHSFAMHGDKLIAVCLYFCAAGFDIVLVRLLTLSLDWVEGEKAKSIAYAQEREVLFTELQHRISNHLQLLSTLLDSQRSHVRDENAKQAMTNASLRLAMVGKLHRKLHDPGQREVDIGALLSELSGDLGAPRHRLRRQFGAADAVSRPEHLGGADRHRTGQQRARARIGRTISRHDHGRTQGRCALQRVFDRGRRRPRAAARVRCGNDAKPGPSHRRHAGTPARGKLRDGRREWDDLPGRPLSRRPAAAARRFSFLRPEAAGRRPSIVGPGVQRGGDRLAAPAVSPGADFSENPRCLRISTTGSPQCTCVHSSGTPSGVSPP